MVIRKSLTWYIIGLIVLVLCLSSLTNYFISDRTQQNNLSLYVNSRDSDIRFVAQTMIEDEAARLKGLARSLMEREDLVVLIAVTSPEDTFIDSLINSMDMLARSLSIDLLEAASPDGVILYSVGTPEMRGMPADYAVPEEYKQSAIRTEVVRRGDEWMIRAVAPLNVGKVDAGTLMVGTRLDDWFMGTIARTTGANLVLGTETDEMVATTFSEERLPLLDLETMGKAVRHKLTYRTDLPDMNSALNYGTTNVLDRDFALITEFDTTEIVQLNQEQRRSHFKVFSTFIVVSLLLSAALAIKLFAPLVTLRMRVEKAVRDIAGKEVGSISGDEIQSLVESFDFMEANIREHLSEKQKMEDSLLEAKQDWENTFNSITDMITIHDKDFNIITANKAAEALMKSEIFSPKSLQSFKCYELFHGTSAPPSGCPACESVKTGAPCIHEVFEPHLNMYLEIRVIPRKDADGELTGLVHVVRDISDRKKMEDDLTRQALYDALTGLPNRALLSDRLKNLFEHRTRDQEMLFAVLFLDLDHFKRVNDTLGHVFGDKLLEVTAERLRDSVRPGDTVSRFGGDEFVVILDDLSGEREATDVAERIMHNLGKPVIIGGNEIFISASIGIAFSRQAYEKPENMIRDSDNAMYHAKLRGRAQIAIFDEKMRHSTMRAMTMENDLRKAVERGEFVLHYQPIINLKSGLVAGFEALIRWEHPEEGLIEPDMFIPSAEESGLILPIGEWVLETACRQIKKWQEQFPCDPPLSVSVNLSSRQFDSRLPKRVENLLKRTGITPESLQLEVTESVLMEGSSLVKKVIKALLDLGVFVALDDFGTGYSSLRYVHTFPVKALKIDRSFVSGIIEDRQAREIVRAIASLAHNLDMTMIVEGVEEEEQLEIFRELECKYAQGFLFSKALSPHDLESYMLANLKSTT